MEDRRQLLKHLPKIDALLSTEEASRSVPLIGRRAVVDICRAAVEREKKRALESGVKPDFDKVVSEVAADCRQVRSRILGRAINGTGVLLHTNLGRAPLGPELLDEIAKNFFGYCNLEVDVTDRRRGARGSHAVELLAQACEAEDALVVNNNAAALFLILSEFARGKEVIVSRGELVQIGGGFRIPEILAAAGAEVREVGTTNITTADDYRSALGPNTALMLKVHKSNFFMKGFVDAPCISDLSRLDRGDTLLVSDLGSGNLVRIVDGKPSVEPTPAEMLSQGADLVCFSCDKMLGSVQGGVIAGRSNLIARLRANPVMRALRVDKLTFAALQISLTRHLAGEHGKVRLWSMALTSVEELKRRAELIIARSGLDARFFKVVDSCAVFGGGSGPDEEIVSAAIQIDGPLRPDDVAKFLQSRELPVIGTVKQGLFQVDMRAILPEEDEDLADALKALFESFR